MQKLFAALLSLCLILSAFAAFAEEPVAVNWSEYEAQAAGMEGQFAQISSTGLKMFIPAQFKDTELSEETLAGGTFMVLKPEEENAVVNAQVVSIDIELFKAVLAKQGVSTWETVVNGLAFTQFTVEADGILTASFALPTTQNTTLVFSFLPANQEPYTSMFKVMIASLQLAE